MSTADDLRDLRDALDCIAHGALPRWGTMTTKTGEEAQTAAREVYERFVRALHHESAAKFAVAKAEVQTSDFRTHAEALTARCEAAEAEAERWRNAHHEASIRLQHHDCGEEAAKLHEEVVALRAERRQLRARLVECRPWVGVCPFDPAKINEVGLVRDLADDTLEEVKP